jgi:hypothetical protein
MLAPTRPNEPAASLQKGDRPLILSASAAPADRRNFSDRAVTSVAVRRALGVEAGVCKFVKAQCGAVVFLCIYACGLTDVLSWQRYGVPKEGC